jgi:hypothetical protein
LLRNFESSCAYPKREKRFLEREMPMSVKVKDGTPLYGPSLCDSCSRAHIAKGYRATEILVICDALYRDHPVPFPIRECTHYLDKNRRDLEEMEDIAWLLDTPGAKRKAGFAPAGTAEANAQEIELKLTDKE